MILRNRTIRLHRPYFIRGLRDARFGQSPSTCLKAAAGVAIALQRFEPGDGKIEHVRRSRSASII